VSGDGPTGKRVVVTQPYWFPYAGYFRLLAEADVFVLFDCVQFPRRTRVHRCEVPGPGGATEWLTLPLAKQPRDVRICDLEFAPGARAEMDRRLARHPWIASAQGPAADAVREHLHAPLERPVDYLEEGLRLVASLLGLECAFTRSSSLELDPALRMGDRVRAAALAYGAEDYVNAPSGRSLYAAEDFAAEGLGLWFLRPYEGAFFQLLPALLREEPGVVREDVLRHGGLVRG
jgi:hypothetical protein